MDVAHFKSTEKSFIHFCNSSKHRNIKCLLVLKDETTEDVTKKVRKIFEEVINDGSHKNKFFRRKIDIQLL